MPALAERRGCLRVRWCSVMWAGVWYPRILASDSRPLLLSAGKTPPQVEPAIDDHEIKDDGWSEVPGLLASLYRVVERLEAIFPGQQIHPRRTLGRQHWGGRGGPHVRSPSAPGFHAGARRDHGGRRDACADQDDAGEPECRSQGRARTPAGASARPRSHCGGGLQRRRRFTVVRGRADANEWPAYDLAVQAARHGRRRAGRWTVARSATKWSCGGRPPARKATQALRTIGSTRATARTMPSEGNGEKTEEEGRVPHALLRIGVPRSTSAANGAVKTRNRTLRFTGPRKDVRAVTCFNWGNSRIVAHEYDGQCSLRSGSTHPRLYCRILYTQPVWLSHGGCMAQFSSIEWTDHTFNPWWGCTKVSPACDHCYAETWARRMGFDIWTRGKPRRFLSDAYWQQPRRWNDNAARTGRRARVFCASMADVFEWQRGLQTLASTSLAPHRRDTEPGLVAAYEATAPCGKARPMGRRLA